VNKEISENVKPIGATLFAISVKILALKIKVTIPQTLMTA
jgi:hypothetical protein